jgi:hypothetical protein
MAANEFENRASSIFWICRWLQILNQIHNLAYRTDEIILPFLKINIENQLVIHFKILCIDIFWYEIINGRTFKKLCKILK